MGKPCPKHTAEFKRRAVQPCNERGTACAEVAREAGVDPSGLADWVRRASAAAPGAGAKGARFAFILLGEGRRGASEMRSAPGVTGQGCCARRSRGPPGGRIRHGDRGSRHVSPPIGRTMREAGIGPSTGSIASPWDDAALESLMGPVEAGCAHARTLETRDQAALEMFDCIECSCNRVRIHSAPGNLSPEGFEAGHAQEAASAA